MATAYHNLSSYDADTMPDASGMKVAIAAAEWNAEITDALLKGAVDTLLRNGVKEENIYVARVPGICRADFCLAADGRVLPARCRDCHRLCRAGRYASFRLCLSKCHTRYYTSQYPVRDTLHLRGVDDRYHATGKGSGRRKIGQ